MKIENPDNNLPPNLTERLQVFFATRDYVTAQVEKVKSYIVTHFTGLLFAFLALILAFVWYLHNDLKQEMQANKDELKDLILRKQNKANKSTPTASK